MSRIYEDPSRHQNGSDYYSHVHKMARTPSVLTEVPHYPRGPTLFNNQANFRDDYGGNGHQHKQQHTPEVHKTVEVTERITECDRNGNCVVYEKTVDVEAGEFIDQKKKGFKLCNWKTFKEN